jgi:hypothetical protein
MCRIAKQRIDATNLCRPPYCRSVQHALIKGRTKQRDYSRDKVIYTSERVSACISWCHAFIQQHQSLCARLVSKAVSLGDSLIVCRLRHITCAPRGFSSKAKVWNATPRRHMPRIVCGNYHKKWHCEQHKAGGSTSLGSFNHANWCTESLPFLERYVAPLIFLPRVFALIRRLAIKICSAGLPASQEAHSAPFQGLGILVFGI